MLLSFANIKNNATLAASGSAILNVPIGVSSVELICAVTGAVTGTSPTLNISISGIEPVSGAATSAIVTSTNLTATGTSVYLVIGPAIAAAANISAPFVLPSQLKISWTTGGTTPSFGGVYITAMWQ